MSISYEKSTGKIGIIKNKVTCDFYDWKDNPVNRDDFAGKYMEDYPWADVTKAWLTSMQQKKQKII